MITSQRGDDLQLIEHVIDDQIEVVGLLKATVSHEDRPLSMNVKTLYPEASGKVVFVDALIVKPPKLVMYRVGTQHHSLVDDGELII